MTAHQAHYQDAPSTYKHITLLQYGHTAVQVRNTYNTEGTLIASSISAASGVYIAATLPMEDFEPIDFGAGEEEARKAYTFYGKILNLNAQQS